MSSNSKLRLISSKHIIGNYFDTKLSMFGLTPSATEEGAEGPQMVPEGLPSPLQGNEKYSTDFKAAKIQN